ncbi:MAG TPA: M28 family peptidase, partial [Thermoanaerobaculia bacterium]|nr:M28 family peptidase [Thermoanaerobaculia bacterium]
DARTLRRHVTFLTTEVLPRDADHPENLDRAAAYIATAFRAHGARVSEQPFRVRGKMYRNVLAYYGPADETRPLIVVGAHYDAFSANQPLPGADDNASGTAGLLELARLLQQHAPAAPVLLVAFSTEEPPFFGSEQMGSAIHAQSLAAAGRQVAAMISLEMIGCFSGTQTWESPLLSLVYPDSAAFIGVAGGWDDRALARTTKRALRGAGGVEVLSFSGPRAMLDASDQRNYWARGWSAVMVTDTAYLRNPRYHTIRDTADTLDYRRMSHVVDGVFSAVIAVARGVS